MYVLKKYLKHRLKEKKKAKWAAVYGDHNTSFIKRYAHCNLFISLFLESKAKNVLAKQLCYIYIWIDYIEKWP